jgi:GalNAc-alpha-(1->4)-GalNAc-alpha-(1->3)-diNAcBac-PP-undecaprenol alpha-1,4-N-acetyl-D-galactosaminyltransferase
LSNALTEAGYDVTVLTLVEGESFYSLPPKVSYNSIGITLWRSSKLGRLISEAMAFPKCLIAIRQLIKKGEFDIVISFLIETDILIGLCKLTGIRFRHICSERNDPFRRGKLLQGILNQIYKHSSLFVCQSKMVAQFYNMVPRDRRIVIPNAVDPSVIPRRPLQTRKRIVAVGKLMQQKNFQLLINSFSEISHEFDDYVLDIYGEGPLRMELQALINQHNLSKRITLWGARKDVLQQIADADLFVLSSNFEGFPNVLLEAMAIGLPVITTDFQTGVARELVGKENGIIVPVDDKSAMVNALKTLLSDEQKRIWMGMNNREKAREFYIAVIMQEWVNALNSII